MSAQANYLLTNIEHDIYILCMIKKLSLTETDRNFFEIVAQAAFINPFIEERMDLDKIIAGPEASSLWDELVEQAIAAIRRRLQALKDPGLYNQDDRNLLRTAFLFDIFHSYRISFDELILKQIKNGDTPIQVRFAHELVSRISRIGFTAEESRRYLEIFFQMRRAFYFIENGLTGISPSMQKLRSRLWDNIFTCNISWYEKHLWDRMEDFSTLLLGETGTGKGAAAAAIGRSGFIPFDERKGCFAESFTRSFIPINLSQYPESLLESELFGHKKGAFTGAIENHEGIFGRCSPYGSIFLDEIGDVSIPVQIKLLQVLQERTFSPVGSHEKIRFRGRVIAATNRPLDKLRQRGEFRDDFYYRLCSDTIIVPPLRQRIHEEAQELESLTIRILQRMTGDASLPYVQLVQEAIGSDLGDAYAWPGNVRELEQAIRRIIVTRHYHGDTGISSGGMEEKLLTGIKEGTMDAQALLSRYCKLLYRRWGTYEEVARHTHLDRRTVKKYITKTDKEYIGDST